MLFSIYLKELKDCLRDRRTLLLTIVLPIVLMTGFVIIFEQLVSQDKDEVYTVAVTDTFGEEEKEIFRDNEYLEFKTISNPKSAVVDGDAVVGLVFSTNFSESIKEDKAAQVAIMGDPSSQNAAKVMVLIEKELADYEKYVISERLVEKNINLSTVQPFSITYEETIEGDISLAMIAYLIPLILAVSIGLGAGPAAADLFAGEKERRTMEALLMTPVKRSTLLLAKLLTVSTIATLTGIVTLIAILVQIYFFTTDLKAVISFGEKTYYIVATIVLVAIVYAIVCTSILMLTSILAKTVKEAQTYSAPILFLTMLPAFYVMGLGINELKFVYFTIPFMNLYTIFKELFFGIIQFEHIAITLASNLVLAFLIFIICRILFRKDRWVMN